MKNILKKLGKALGILALETLATVGVFCLILVTDLDTVLFNIARDRALARGEAVKPGHPGPALTFFIPCCLIVIFLAVDLFFLIRGIIREKKKKRSKQ